MQKETIVGSQQKVSADDEQIDVLIAISVVAKRLADKLRQEKESMEKQTKEETCNERNHEQRNDRYF